ncbi:MAG: anthranilate synthase component I family protein, partial [bacterium]
MPDIDRVEARLEEYNIVPVYQKYTADTITPVSAYLALSRGAQRRGFLLESVEKGDQISRYSFLGVDPAAEISLEDGQLRGIEEFDCSATGDPFAALQQIINNWDVAPLQELPGYTGGLVGYFGYETINFIEPTVSVHFSTGKNDFPDCHLFFADTTVIFDHVERSVYLVGHLHRGEGAPVEQYREIEENLNNLKNIISKRPPLARRAEESRNVEERVTSNFSPGQFQEAVRRAKETIQAGETFQVVISQRFELEDNSHPFNLYRRLRGLNPSPYMFYFDFDDFQLVGASPEMLVQKSGEEVHTRPIAGTRRRGENPGEDQR